MSDLVRTHKLFKKALPAFLKMLLLPKTMSKSIKHFSDYWKKSEEQYNDNAITTHKELLEKMK